ncbi:MAG: hypothetical protein WC705_03695 [Candidatus Paceibacterota bacterium]
MKKLSMLVGIMTVLGIMSIAIAQARPVSRQPRFIDLRPSQKLCLAVMTPAVNVRTGECKTFSNSCIPDGWVRADFSSRCSYPESDR